MLSSTTEKQGSSFAFGVGRGMLDLESDPMRGRPMAEKILVVDDELKMVKLVRTYLEGAGFQVVVAYEGQEAAPNRRPGRGPNHPPHLQCSHYHAHCPR
jgi:PleD family two-component response regulator